MPSNGVLEITEVKIGADGIVIANKDAGADLSLKQVLLARQGSPDPKGGDKLVANPTRSGARSTPACRTWKSA